MRDIYRAGLRILGLCVLASLINCGGDGGGGSGFAPIVPPSGNAPPTTNPPPGDGPPVQATGELKIRTLSNRADMISDGDAYVEITLPEGKSALDLAVDLDGKDISSAFALRANGRVLGTVTGLRVGSNTLTATLKSTKTGAKLAIENFARGGNIFAGTPVQPWICATKAGSVATVTVPGTGLSASVTTQVSGLDADPVDADCNAPTVYTYYYQPKAKEGTDCGQQPFGPYACFVQYDPAKRPKDADIANFTTDRGDTVKALLRVELGTMGRSEYQVAVYFDPAKPWTPWEPQKGWNGKVLWKMGASASGNRFQQNPGTALFDDNALRAGFMTVNSQLTNHNDNNNEFLATENIMMVKEHIVDTYGEIRFTMSDGGSGGSMMQTVPASVMPGLLDGLQTGYSYPDAVTTWIETRDCGNLWRYYGTGPGAGLSLAARAAIEGHPTADYCTMWVYSFLAPQNPVQAPNCGPGFPAALVYDPVLRPNGVRCTIHDVMTAILGTTELNGNTVPNLPYDNAGVQYGLKALRSGAITPEEFVALNEGIGSWDADMVWSGDKAVIPAVRARAQTSAMTALYRSGLVSYAKNLAKVPIIDLRPELGADIHMAWRTFEQRARLDAGNGGHDNHVVLASAAGTGVALTKQAFLMMDRWLSAMEADTSSDAKEKKVVKNKPSDAVDLCLATAGMTNAELVDVGFTTSACPVRPYESVRIVSGGPLSEDVFKCQLKPIDFASADYAGIRFTGGQQVRLQATFPDGVCNWSKPGVGQVPWTPTTFRNGPGGQDLPAAPVSMAF
ncbi:DUF6351 family protein [Variovorax sp. IB41]|uniref:DUF6351 family protein n=1 Tax=Variovorax sp. IB41 TaxID=2779370 RepID=UPI0018E76E72|nr:DUF6351 family protein [Variovorax sp. IB41]MBJ2159161.1 hypothetical protein [Variovorax sp. IB41]